MTKYDEFIKCFFHIYIHPLKLPRLGLGSNASNQLKMLPLNEIEIYI